jgi:putative endonuclease
VFANFLKRIRPGKPLGNRTAEEIGSDGEKAAVKYLARQGLHVVERNWSCRFGEMDIICRHRDTWVFVEVKSSHRMPERPPEARVDADKQRRLKRLAHHYLGSRAESSVCRFDVVSVWWEGDEIRIRHNENAF